MQIVLAAVYGTACRSDVTWRFTRTHRQSHSGRSAPPTRASTDTPCLLVSLEIEEAYSERFSDMLFYSTHRSQAIETDTQCWRTTKQPKLTSLPAPTYPHPLCPRPRFRHSTPIPSQMLPLCMWVYPSSSFLPLNHYFTLRTTMPAWSGRGNGNRRISLQVSMGL